MQRLLTFAIACVGLGAAASPHYDVYRTGSNADVAAKTSAGLLLAGGGGDPDEAFRWLIAKAGGGDIVVLRASGSDGYNTYLPTVGTVSSVTTFVIRSAEAAADSDLIRTIGLAEAVFLAGGDQWNYVRMWKRNAIGRVINDAFRRGVPVGGSSAGLAVLGEYAFSAANDTVTSAQALANPYDARVTIETEFLEFPPLRGMITDSHFSRRDRMGRLLVFLARLRVDGKPDPRGIGIDEATAVLVEADGKARVVGKGAAYMVRLTSRPAVCRPGTALDGAEYEIRRASARDGAFDLRKWSSLPGKPYRVIVREGQLRSTSPSGALY